MATKNKSNTKKSVLRINKLRGHMLFMFAPKSKRQEILIVHGLNMTIDSMNALAKIANKSGAVTVPDLPGFGGMDSFYSIGIKPTIDNFAGFLATFIELRYHRKRNIKIITVGEASILVTAMLQNHKKAADKVDSVIAIGGLLHKNDTSIKKGHLSRENIFYSLMSKRLISWVLSSLIIRTPIVFLISSIKKKSSKEIYVHNLRANDLRTYAYLNKQLLKAEKYDRSIKNKLRLIKANIPPNIDQDALKHHAIVVYKSLANFHPKHSIDDIADLYDYSALNKSIGAKLKSWL